MEIIIDKLLLYVLGVFLALRTEQFFLPVVVSLIALTYAAASLEFYAPSVRRIAVLAAAFLAAGLFFPELFAFLPLVCYDVIWYFPRYGWLLPAALVFAFWKTPLLLFGLLLSALLSVRTKKQLWMKRELIRLHDSSTEQRNRMQQRQDELLEKQDYEIHVATLQERNRIAREIHDNVGHILSRSILQMGALLTLYKKDGTLHEQLAAVSDTLNEAMDRIRESVHDLHDESFDLHQAALDAVKDMRQNYAVSLDYDMGEHIPRKISYCLIAVIKEALSNVVKHSDATRITLLLREHPGFYQLLFEDNGTHAAIPENSGIGLCNMQDRVEALNGRIRFSTENGFGILLSIPKQQKE